MNDLQLGLIVYGIRRMARATGEDGASLITDLVGKDPPQLNADAFEKLLGEHDEAEHPQPLRAVLSMVTFEDKEAPSPAYYRPEILSLTAEEGKPTEAPIFPKGSTEGARRADLRPLWDGFADECRRALDGGEKDFLRFFYLMRKYAWALPCTYGEEGVSLFEQFKAVAALVFASRSLEKPAEDYLLVGGDIPGIQGFVYTITSKGAAKGLRGRSFFLQLLGDAVVRKLVTHLELCPANVVYAAGGNFTLLAPKDSAQEIDDLQQAMNQALLDEFKTDLFLCLAHVEVTRDELRGAAFAEASRRLKGKVAKKKRQPFARIAKAHWEDIFAPQGTGGLRYCTITQRELSPEEPAIPIPDAEPGLDGRPPVMSQQTCGFVGLAEAIGGTRLPLMVVSQGEPEPLEIDNATPYAFYRSYLPYWRHLLWKVTGWQYDFVSELSPAHRGREVYAVNDTNFLGKGADGFLYLGNVTPRISEADIAWFRATYPDEAAPQQEEFIKDFDLMGRQAAGIKRVGVLRMDVDDLGRASIEGLKPRTMARVSAFSQALELFFAGWLNEICEDVQASTELLPDGFERQATDLLYIIYSGGDDLFVVGAWDRLPLLAERIHHDFAAFTGHNPTLHISAGLTLEQRKFPLYRAAERAHNALDDGAKVYKRVEDGDKDAITFLEQTFGWEDFVAPEADEDRFSVKEGTQRLIDLLERGVPRSLLQIVQSIYGQYRRDLKRNLKRRPTCGPTGKQLYYGRWMWIQAYQMRRLADRQEAEGVKEAIRRLQRDLMTPKNVRYSGLAARWAEYLTRKER